MKKHSVIAFASALTIAAGIICTPTAAFDAESNQIEAAVRKDGSLFAAQDEDGIAYEDAIADLYARSTTISDKEILEIARKMKPDCTAVAEELGDVQAAQIMDTLADYEEAKASYLLDSETAQADSSVSAEWTRQDRYTRMGMSSAQKLTSLIPGYTVTSCSEENGQILVDIDEWMTEGYTEGADQNTENVSAYRYYFTAVLSQDGTGNWEVASITNTDRNTGNWEVASITNTDRNFTWLEDIEEQEKNYEGEDQMLFADAADQIAAELTEADIAAGQIAADQTTAGAAANTAAADDLQAGAIRTSSLKTYGDGRYPAWTAATSYPSACTRAACPRTASGSRRPTHGSTAPAPSPISRNTANSWPLQTAMSFAATRSTTTGTATASMTTRRSASDAIAPAHPSSTRTPVTTTM